MLGICFGSFGLHVHNFPFRNVDELVEMVNVHPAYYIIAIVIMLVLIMTLYLNINLYVSGNLDSIHITY